MPMGDATPYLLIGAFAANVYAAIWWMKTSRQEDDAASDDSVDTANKKPAANDPEACLAHQAL